MQIMSFVFFALVAVLLIVVWILNKTITNETTNIKVTNSLLLVASYAFVIYADWRFAVVLFVLSISTWYCAQNRKLNSLGIVIAVLVLAFFKYMNFFIDSFSKAFGLEYTSINLILPLGISFYTFSAISYIVDVKHKKNQPASIADVALYLSFFPKITCGPIQRSGDFFSQINKKREIGLDSFSTGIQIFVFGLFKKMVFADRLAVFVDEVYNTPAAFSSLTVFLAAIAYSFQIYFDFSGYCDMAVGVAKMLGFDLPRNFNLPYLAQNVTELWKRWHITLSSWLKDYLYIPLGGNRKGKFRTYINLILTMLIGGLWHGANVTFIIWGALHGFALAVHKIWIKVKGSDTKSNSVISKFISVCVTFLFTTFCWIFFRAESLSQAFVIIKRIFSFEEGIDRYYSWLIAIAIVSIIYAIIQIRKTKKRNSITLKKTNTSIAEDTYLLVNLKTFWGRVIFFVFCGLLVCLAYVGNSAFIYGKF